jgi:hypothetical protein
MNSVWDVHDAITDALAALRRAREAYAFNPNSYTPEALRLIAGVVDDHRPQQPLGVAKELQRLKQ